MKYMLLIYDDEKAWAKLSVGCNWELVTYCPADWSGWVNRMYSPMACCCWVSSAATSVRARSGKRLVTDGPFAETREQLLGYYIIDVNDLDVAIAIAARIPGGPAGGVEIRPLVERAAQATT